MQCQSHTQRFKIRLQRDDLSSFALLNVVVFYMMVILDHLNCHKMTSTQVRPPLWPNATWRIKLRSRGLKLSVVLTRLLLPSLAG